MKVNIQEADHRTTAMQARVTAVEGVVISLRFAIRN
jgi:hypothetical protein